MVKPQRIQVNMLLISIILTKIFTLVGKYPVLFTTFYLATVGNVAFWLDFQKINTGSVLQVTLFSLSFLLLLVLLTAVLLNFFRFRYLLKAVLIFILVASSFASYFMTNYGIMIDTSMIFNLAETDVNEAGELITMGLLWHVLFFGLIPASIIYKAKIIYLTPIKQLAQNSAFIVLCIIAITTNTLLFSTGYASFFRNHHDTRYLINPINYVYSVSKYLAQTIVVNDMTPIQIGLDAQHTKEKPSNQKKFLLVIVVGETARAMNFSLNGYKKMTNPVLAKEDILNYPNFYSCGTSTHVSLPCMFSMFGREEFDEALAKRYEKLPDVLQRAGLDVFWRDNNSGCKGVCKNIPTENTNLVHLYAVCSSSECYDEAMLVNLKQNIENRTRDTVVILHQKGSHGPAYYLRHPGSFQKFTPECQSKELTNCSTQEIVNAYDNTILYTDYFLGKVISFLKQESEKFDTAMLYISDHGESLGEHNVYLHGLPYMFAPEEQKHVPFISWFSDGFIKSNQLNRSCLKRNVINIYSHDNLFHSVLGLTQVSTSIYKPELDIFRPCKIVLASL